LFVSAWAQSQRLVLGQKKVEGKSNENDLRQCSRFGLAIPDLIDSLALQGALVSIDAGPADKRAFGSGL
jgi:hypothetical protein